MRSLILIILITLFFEFNSNAQKIYVLANATTKEIIPFGLVSIDSTNGIYSNQNGAFNIYPDSVSHLDIAVMGYENIYLDVSKIQNDTIFLSEKPVLLKEVKVFGNTTKYKTDFLKIKKNQVSSFGILKHTEMLTRIYPESNLIGKLEMIHLSFDNRRSRKNIYTKNSQAIIRLNVYENDSVLSKIYNSDPIKIAGFKGGIIDIDLSNLNLFLEDSGLAFGIEYIGHIDEEGELLKEAKTIQPNITTGNSSDFKQTTLVRSNYGNKDMIIPSLNDFIIENIPQKIKKIEDKRNVAIAFTILK